MRAEELGLGLAAVAALGVPPAGPVAVDLCAGGLLNRDVVTGHGDQRSLPFFVAKSCLAFKDNLPLR